MLHDYNSGYYCPIGSAAVIHCPAGTWGSSTGLATVECSGQCTEGTFISTLVTGLKIFHLVIPQKCVPGYYCPTGSISATANICPIGYVRTFQYMYEILEWLSFLFQYAHLFAACSFLFYLFADRFVQLARVLQLLALLVLISPKYSEMILILSSVLCNGIA